MTEARTRAGRLEDRVVLVTGGAQGIGFAAARAASSEGAHVVLGDVQADRGADAAKSIDATFVELDVTSVSSVVQAVDAVVAQFGRVDVLVNNAGAAVGATARDTSREVLQWILDVDLIGLFEVTRYVGEQMIAANSGSIVNLASVSSLIASSPEPLFAYSAAKAGVAQMTRNLAAEWAQFGIRVNAVSPGRVNTEMLVSNSTEQMRSQFVLQTPLRRLIEPEEVAAAIVFLASDDASAVTGHNLVVDGGQVVV